MPTVPQPKRKSSGKRRALALEIKQAVSWLHDLLDEQFKAELKVKKRRDVPLWREA